MSEIIIVGLDKANNPVLLQQTLYIRMVGNFLINTSGINYFTNDRKNVLNIQRRVFRKLCANDNISKHFADKLKDNKLKIPELRALPKLHKALNNEGSIPVRPIINCTGSAIKMFPDFLYRKTENA